MPRAPVSGGSATAASLGTAVEGATKAVRGKILEMAKGDMRSPFYNIPESDLTLQNGKIFRMLRSRFITSLPEMRSWQS